MLAGALRPNDPEILFEVATWDAVTGDARVATVADVRRACMALHDKDDPGAEIEI